MGSALTVLPPPEPFHADVKKTRDLIREVFRKTRIDVTSMEQVRLVKQALLVGQREGYTKAYFDSREDLIQPQRRK